MTSNNFTLVQPKSLAPGPSWMLKMLTLAVVIIEVVILAVHPLVLQDPGYHNFADARKYLGVANFWNVISNCLFLFVALLAAYNGLIRRKISLLKELIPAYVIFFLAIGMVSVGSAGYHFHPDDTNLVWDRLPMTLAFTTLLSICFAEFMSISLGRILLWPSLVLGLFSVGYWHYTGLQGKGDLRMYAFVQMTPVLMIPLLLLAGRNKFDSSQGYWMLLLCYVLSKIAEYFDEEIFAVTQDLIGGHALKHLLIAIGLYCLLRNYMTRNVAANAKSEI